MIRAVVTALRRSHEDLIEDGWKVSQKSVADSMARQGLNAQPKKKGRNLTRPDKAAKPTPDLVGTGFFGRPRGPEMVRGLDRDPH